MGLLLVLAVGAVVGWLASVLTGTRRETGPLADVVIGVLGSLLGFMSAHAVGLEPRGPASMYVAALAGAVLMVLLLRAFGAFRRTSRHAGHESLSKRS